MSIIYIGSLAVITDSLDRQTDAEITGSSVVNENITWKLAEVPGDLGEYVADGHGGRWDILLDKGARHHYSGHYLNFDTKVQYY